MRRWQELLRLGHGIPCVHEQGQCPGEAAYSPQTSQAQGDGESQKQHLLADVPGQMSLFWGQLLEDSAASLEHSVLVAEEGQKLRRKRSLEETFQYILWKVVSVQYQ
jgi:hypothetical protein